MIDRRALLAMAAVVDIALHARGQPVAAGALARRHGLQPRNFETVLRDLVRARILKGTRGPRGGYELGRERRRISLGDIVRAVETSGKAQHRIKSDILETTIIPAVATAIEAALRELDATTVEYLIPHAQATDLPDSDTGAFAI